MILYTNHKVPYIVYFKRTRWFALFLLAVVCSKYNNVSNSSSIIDLAHVLVTVVEKSRQGIARRTDATQMITIKIRAIVLDIRGSNGLTIAIYLKWRVQYIWISLFNVYRIQIICYIQCIVSRNIYLSYKCMDNAFNRYILL